MPSVNRRRGSQPGNTNALKHGLYQDKPAPGQRPKGAPPGNLNSLSHGKYTCLNRPFQPPASLEFSNPTGYPDSPSKATPLKERPFEARPSKARPSASLAGLFSLLELQLLDLLDRPFNFPNEPLHQLYELNAELIRLLRNLPKPDPCLNPPGPTERNLP